MIYAGFALAVCVLLAAMVLIKRRMRQRASISGLAICSPRGVVEEGYVRIGGIDQWIGIRGEDRDNPLLVVLHGGPGCSYTIFTPHMRGWEKSFTIVQWDQRGSGRTYRRNGKRRGTISFEQLSRDAEEVVEYARTRMGKERVFLLASSLGSTFGMRVVRRQPDLLHAYIGVDQNTGMKWGRHEEHTKVVERLRAQGLMKGVRAMQRMGADAGAWSVRDYEAVARWTMRSDAAGFSRTMDLLKDAVWYAPNWSLGDVRSFVKGMHHSLQSLLPEIVAFDAWVEGVEFKVPFFIFQGESDMLTTPAAARAFFDDVVAPEKRFKLIADAGHFAAFVQPQKLLQELTDHVRPLAKEPRPAAIS